MIFWIIAALLTAFISFLAVKSLRIEHKKLSWILVILLPLLAIILYLCIGNPEMGG